MGNMAIQQVLTEMRALQARAQGAAAQIGSPLETADAVSGAPTSEFAAMLKKSIDGVAKMQNQASALSDAYEAGDKSVDLTKVMLEVQKAGLAFRAMTEVRNKLIDAYSQVMNMSV